jgi:hypothetical protein
MTSSTRHHGAIHLRQTMKAIQANATQIRTMTNKVTALIIAHAAGLANASVGPDESRFQR